MTPSNPKWASYLRETLTTVHQAVSTGKSQRYTVTDNFKVHFLNGTISQCWFKAKPPVGDWAFIDIRVKVLNHWLTTIPALGSSLLRAEIMLEQAAKELCDEQETSVQSGTV